MKNKKK